MAARGGGGRRARSASAWDMGTAVSGAGGASMKKGWAPQGGQPGGWRRGGRSGGLAGCAGLALGYWGPSPRLARTGAPPPAPPLPPRAAPSERPAVWILVHSPSPQPSPRPRPIALSPTPPRPAHPPSGSFLRAGCEAVGCPPALRVRKPVWWGEGGMTLDRERKCDLSSQALERGGWLPQACTPQIR